MLMNISLTVAFLFGGAGFFGPVEQPNGNGGTIVYEQVASLESCTNPLVHAEIPNGNGGSTYFCQTN